MEAATILIPPLSEITTDIKSDNDLDLVSSSFITTSPLLTFFW